MSRRTFLFGALASSFILLGEGTPGGATDYPDAFVADQCSSICRFIDWLDGTPGYIGETGVPSNLGQRAQFYPDQEKWRTLKRYWFREVNRAGIPVTMHSSYGEFFYRSELGGNHHSVYLCPGDDIHRVVDRRAYQAYLLEYWLGLNAKGLNFPGGQLGRSVTNTDPGEHGKDYTYPTLGAKPISPRTGKNSFEYLASRGHKWVRTGFRWERVQPELFGSLRRSEMDLMERCVRNAASAGLKVVLDCHADGCYEMVDGKHSIGSDRVPVEAFVDLWRRLGRYTLEWPIFAYDLCNEPTNDGSKAEGFGEVWEDATRRSVEAIRGEGNGKLCMVPIYGWPDSLPWRHKSGPWIDQNALGPVRYTLHDYHENLKELHPYDYYVERAAGVPNG